MHVLWSIIRFVDSCLFIGKWNQIYKSFICLGKVVVPSPKKVLNLPWNYNKLHCKGELSVHTDRQTQIILHLFKNFFWWGKSQKILFTFLPKYEEANPTIEPPIMPPTQKMATTQDQMSVTVVGSRHVVSTAVPSVTSSGLLAFPQSPRIHPSIN